MYGLQNSVKAYAGILYFRLFAFIACSTSYSGNSLYFIWYMILIAVVNVKYIFGLMDNFF